MGFVRELDKVWDDLSGSLGRRSDLKKAPPRTPRAMTRAGGA